MRLHRARRRLLGAGLAALVAANGCGSNRVDDPPAAPVVTVVAGNAVVERVIDGDTIVVRIDGHAHRVRLLGIDTPETVDPNRPKECYGPEASARAEALLPPGTPVRLEGDREAVDRYGRLLAFVIRATDGLLVNLDLLRTGHAEVMIIRPNTTHSSAFLAAERSARAAGLGLWGACTNGPGRG